jgi:hypothetical protein
MADIMLFLNMRQINKKLNNLCGTYSFILTCHKLKLQPSVYTLSEAFNH